MRKSITHLKIKAGVLFNIYNVVLVSLVMRVYSGEINPIIGGVVVGFVIGACAIALVNSYDALEGDK